MLVELTFTTSQRWMLLRPSAAVNDIVAGVLAMAAERNEVGVVAVTASSSHLHVLAKLRDA